MNRKLRKYDDDDGRVIVNMDVEGMPWHDKSIRQKKSKPVQHEYVQGVQMTNSEYRRYNWYALLAGFTIASVFSVTWILFVLFCIYIWFR